MYFFFALAAMTAGVVLAIFALSYDRVQKWTQDFSDPYYCGWQEFHKAGVGASDQDSDDDDTWEYACKNVCSDDDCDYCKMEDTGKAWLALLCIGIFFGALSAAGFFFQYVLLFRSIMGAW